VKLGIVESLRDLISLTLNWHFAGLGEVDILNIKASELYQRLSVQA
jgi:hypothetical protein